MFYHDGGKLQYPVRVEKPSAIFAKALQQAIGGIQGEIRVCLQYMFQAWGARGPSKYRDMLLETGTEEMAHIEMLATAVALNLEGAPLEQEEAAKDPLVYAALGGMNIQHVIGTCMAAMPVDSEGVPFNCSHVYASGNTAADMLANASAESTGRMLACQLHRMTNDPGMKDMLSYLVARDTMHQNQWMAAVKELQEEGLEQMPVPSNFPQAKEATEFSYDYYNFSDGAAAAEGSWAKGRTPDGNGTFGYQAEPMKGVPMPPPTHPDARFYGTTEVPNRVEKAAGTIQDKLNKE